MEALGESDIEGIVKKLGDYSISGLIVKLIQFKYKKSEEMEKYEKLEMPRERIRIIEMVKEKMFKENEEIEYINIAYIFDEIISNSNCNVHSHFINYF